MTSTLDSTGGDVSIVNVFLEIRPMLLRVINSHTKSNQIAQDLTQDIYFKVISLAKSFPTHDDARNYLIRIAINLSIDHLRTDERRKQLLLGSMELFNNYQNDDKKPEDILIIQEKIEVLDSTLAALPEKYKQVLYLSRMEGLTHLEIAQKLGISKSSVEKYIIRALTYCQENIIFDE
jgi:RNA polymerase sigma-70 factor (ECF subfamily)